MADTILTIALVALGGTGVALTLYGLAHILWELLP